MAYAPCIAIVSPSGYAPDQAVVQRAIARLEAHGCRVKCFYDPAAIHQRFGASDEARAAPMHAAARDAEVEVVLALRGGYGMSRLLPLLDMPLLVRSGKRFVGHSDFTALQLALLAQAQTISYAGPMACSDFGTETPSDYTMQHFWGCLSQPCHEISVPARGNAALDITGTLWGGNLSMLCHLVGTPYFPQVEQGILFVEDINEHPYRVERLLLQLQLAGVLERQQALVLGDFSGYRLVPYDNGYDFESMVDYVRERFRIPVVTGLPFGHVHDKVTLAVGAQARLRCTAAQLTLSMAV